MKFYFIFLKFNFINLNIFFLLKNNFYLLFFIHKNQYIYKFLQKYKNINDKKRDFLDYLFRAGLEHKF